MNLEKLNKIEEKLFDVLAEQKINVREIKTVLHKMLEDIDERSILEKEVVINIETLIKLSGEEILNNLKRQK